MYISNKCYSRKRKREVKQDGETRQESPITDDEYLVARMPEAKIENPGK